MILFRGMNAEFYERHGGKLIPKETGPFIKAPEFGVAERGNSYWGANEENAVVTHQLHQAGYATCGISFTPIYERAVVYATHDGKFKKGFVYETDTQKCAELDVSIYTVSEIVPSPSIPEDKEVVLVAKEFGALPNKLITNVHEVGT